jgi:hypothetical protein
MNALFDFVRREKITSAIILVLIASAVGLVATSLSRPEPLSFPASTQAVTVDSARGRRRLTIDASDETRWRFVSLRRGEVLPQPATLDWDLGFRRFHIATNGGPGFAGSGAAGVTRLEQTSADTSKSGFGKWYNYGLTSHLLTPKPVEYLVLGADAARYRLRILSYYCPGATPGCITIEYEPTR